MKKRTKKLNLTRETVTNLDPEKLGNVGGQAQAGSLLGCCQESVFVCSVMHTCYSCNGGGDTTIVVAA